MIPSPASPKRPVAPPSPGGLVGPLLEGLPPMTPPLDPAYLTDIFVQNRLTSVMKTETDFRNYLVHALRIDAGFIGRFDVHALISAIEHTLHCRPPPVATEPFLKSQRLWIMQKLLRKMGFRDKLNALMHVPPSASTIQLRQSLSQMLLSFFQHVNHPNSPPLHVVVGQMTGGFQEFCRINERTLHMEKKRHVERRCSVIRWFSWIVVHHGEDWIHTTDISELKRMFQEYEGGHAAPSKPRLF